MNKTEAINLRVLEAIANGERTITEKDTYLQHLLREHPNVCRQTLRYTDTYVIHAEACGCPPEKAVEPVRVAEGTCCGIIQPAESECWMCGEAVTKS